MKQTTKAIRGIYRDLLRGADGCVLYDSDWQSNTIVDRCHILLAMLMANREGVQGIQFFAVGQGDPSWDMSGPPGELHKASDLTSRFDPAIPWADLKVAYLNDNDEVVDTPTSRLQITATLAREYPTPSAGSNTYPLREFGLFGRLGNQEYMINYVRHPVIHKDTSSTLIRTLRLHF